MGAFAGWSQLFSILYMARSKGMYPHAKDLIDRILAHDDQTLHNRAKALSRIIGDRLPLGHDHGIAELLSSAGGNGRLNKGAVYLSPLKDSPTKRELLPRLYKIKTDSKLPVFVYLIQRL